VDPRRPEPVLVRARVAVAVLFVLNGAVYANIVPRLPAIKAELGLSNTALGTAVAAMPVGALVSGLLAGRLIARFGSGRLAVACGVAFGFVLPLLGVAPSWGALAGGFLALGLLDALMDVAMNAHGLRVQRGYGRSIVSALHGLWSVGAVLGGLAGAAAAGLDVRPGWHLLAAGAAVLVVSLVMARHTLPGPDDEERDDAAAEQATGGRRGTARRLGVLGLLVVLAAVVEDAPASWGAVLLRDELGTSAAVGGLVFIAFQVSMVVGRLLGDRIVDRYGEAAVVRAGALVTAAAVGAGLLVGEPASIIAGFAVAGLGAASLFPVVFHAAGNLPGVSTGHGVAVVGWMSRMGFLVVPPLVGAVGDASSLRAGLVLAPVAGLAIAALAGTLPGRVGA
jgi:MFS family permease